MIEHFDSTNSHGAAVLGNEYAVANLLSQTPAQSSAHAEPQATHAGQQAAGTFRYRVIKRGFEILLVLLASPLMLPVFAAVAVIVWIDCPGPVFFSHRRIRRDNTPFPMWKFRTMCVNSAEVLESRFSCEPKARTEWRLTHKLRDDPRVTRIGTLLRQYSVDELPQVWNVLTGEMSLIGPRPIVAAEIEKYGPHFSCYCKVKPGITGLWQVSGRSYLSYGERVALDCEYVHRWSLLLDLKILLKTFSSVINRHGAF